MDTIFEVQLIFVTKLLYNELLPTVNNTGDEQYNGNIAAVKWNTPEFGVKAYGYGYGNINRLERAKFAAGTALNTDIDKYSVDYSYDANGNILTLGRHNTATGYIDNLTMTYDGNQLKTADDSGDLALGFYDGIDAEIEYHYDHNGNMDVDDNKGFTFTYNYLNLPKEIVGGNDTVRYIYDASGEKLSKELVQGGVVSYTDYVGNFVYKDGDLDYISTGEGRITEPTAGTIQYEYFLKDHLGNTRTVFADGNGDGVLTDNEVLQENHYYPFGMQIGGLAVDRGADCKLKYNAKELQDDVLDGVRLNYYAYGWRDYDPIVPHFNRMDRFSEKYYSFSPYQYAANNPILFIDVNGDSIDVSGLSESQLETYNSNLEYLMKSELFSAYYNQLLESETVYTISVKKGEKGTPSEAGQFFKSSTNEVGLGENMDIYVMSQELFHAFQSDGGFYSDNKPKPYSTIETEGDIVSMYVMLEAELMFPSHGDWDQDVKFDAFDNGTPGIFKVQSAGYQQMFQTAVDKRIDYYRNQGINVPTYTSPNRVIKPKALEGAIILVNLNNIE